MTDTFDHHDTATAGLDPAAGETWDPTVTSLLYPTAQDWVEQWLARIYRPQNPGRWCPRWWDHPEAASRLGALWAAWETAQSEGGAQPSYWWQHFDREWAAITHTSGPFALCTGGKHIRDNDRMLPTQPKPELDDEPGEPDVETP